MSKMKSAGTKDKRVYVYIISEPKQEEELVMTNTHQEVLYHAGTVYYKPRFQLIPWTKKKKEITNEMYHPQSQVWIIPKEQGIEWRYPVGGKPAAMVKEAYAFPQTVYDLLTKEYVRMNGVYHKIEENKKRSGPPVRTILGLLPPFPPAPPKAELFVPLEEKVKRK